MMLVILKISDAMIRETRLPNGAMLIQPIRKSSFDELHRPFQGDFSSRREERMNVVGHDDELVEKKFPQIAIVRERID